MTDKNSILIVDDQESIIKSLKRLLLSEPYNILSASDGPSALEVLKEYGDKIFLIISDQRMPHITGTQFLEQSVEIAPDTIRFILSGYADRDDVVTALNNKTAHKYLTKPWNNDELLIIIEQAYKYPDKVRACADSNSCFLEELSESNIIDRDIKKFDEHRKDIFLGRVAVHHGFISRQQLDSSMTVIQSQRQAGRNVSLENILFEQGLISSEDMGKIIAVTRRRMGRTFAKSAIQNFGIPKSDIEKALAIQAQEFNNTSTCRLLGDILVSEKVITEEQKESIIIDQIYSERAILSDKKSDSSLKDDGGHAVSSNSGDSPKIDHDKDNLKNEIILSSRKKNFFRQRALDKIFCKSAIKRNFATESEILAALEEQLIHFTKTFEIKLIKDILIGRSIISIPQAQIIINSSVSQENLSSQQINPQQTDLQQTNLKETDALSQKESKEQIISIENNAFELTISSDEMEASIALTGQMPEGMNAEKLKGILYKNNVVYGLADDIAIEMFIRRTCVKKDKNNENISADPQNSILNNLKDNNINSLKDEKFIIAKGRPPKSGRNALIKYFFEDENKKFGKELSSGRFDYRERGEIPNISQGTLLAEKIPVIPQVNGITVSGYEVLAQEPLDVNLECGQGAELSKDGLKVIAKSNGRPDLSLGGRITVQPSKIIKGNVDFRTGNVKFKGDIIVQGAILPEFKVKGSSLTVNDIEEAEVDILNNIFVKNSVNASRIKTGGNFYAPIITKSTIFAQGDVIIQKEIIECTIVTSGKVIVQKGRIVASTIHAAKGIEALNIGSDVAQPCHLFIGSDDYAQDIIKTFEDKLESHQEDLLVLEETKSKYQEQSWQQLNELGEISKNQEYIAIDRKKLTDGKKRTTDSSIIKQMDNVLSELSRRALKMDQAINRLFDENDIIQTKTSEIKAEINSVKFEIESIEKEKSNFQIWYESQKKEALKKGISVIVQGNIFARNHITGVERSIILKENIKNSKFQEILNKDDPNKPFYEILITPLGSKGKQPHIYRV